MKRLFCSLLALGVCLTPVIVTLTPQSTWAQTQDVEIQRLIEQATQLTNQGQHLQAIETFQRLLTVARQQEDKRNEAFALLGIGFNSTSIYNLQEGLEYYKQALVIFRKIKDRSGEAVPLIILGSSTATSDSINRH